MPWEANNLDRVITSSVESRLALGVRATPSAGMQYWPEDYGGKQSGEAKKRLAVDGKTHILNCSAR